MDAMAAKQKEGGREVICKNRRARREYRVDETFEAGLVLQGSEVKSCRQGSVSINDALVRIVKNEAYLFGSHIAEYKQAGPFNHEPGRERKLLLHRKQIDKLEIQLRQEGQAAVPLALYFKGGRVKVEVAVGKGRSFADRRDLVRERETQREVRRAMLRGQKRG
jgi:SsrA-binding protein